MAERVQNVNTYDPNGVDSNSASNGSSSAAHQKKSTAIRVIWYIAGVINTLLAIRFVLVLLGANASNGFVNLIYTLSYPFAAPFFGMFNYSTHYGASRFEASTLVAIAIYSLIAWGLVKLINIRHAR